MRNILFYWICIQVVSLGPLWAQDSLNTPFSTTDFSAQEILEEAQKKRSRDSLAREAVLIEIARLQSFDQDRKKALEKSLDSLKRVKEERLAAEKIIIDSLRTNRKGEALILFKDSLFEIYAPLGPFTPQERVESVKQKVELLVKEGLFNPNQLSIRESDDSYDLMHEEIVLISATNLDAFWENSSKELLITRYKESLTQSIEAYQKRSGVLANLKRVLYLILVLSVVGFGVRFLNQSLEKASKWVLQKAEAHLKGVKLKTYEFLSAEREKQVLIWLLNFLKWTGIVIVVYLALPVIFSLFPATKGIANTLLGYVLNPIKAFFQAIIGYLPEVITILIIVFLTRYILRFLKFLSKEVDSGKLQIPGFYNDWAVPTYNLLKIIVLAFAFILVFPYLPGSSSPVFRGVSVFFGLLISLGSTSAIGNIIAGLVITYMRSFKIGDRVKIGDTTGDVIEKSMLVTRLRTIKNEDVSIPNSAILNGSTINFSSSAHTLGLILNSSITIGYDVPWRKVHELLISAALKTQHVKQDPQPFVLQTSLDDYYVSYQINMYTEEAGLSAKIYSELHAHIQDAFNQAGVEILSPAYMAARDGNMVAIPKDSLPENYKGPSFEVKINQDPKG